MKYVVFELDAKEMIFVFPRDVQHDRMAEGCSAIRFGSEQNWDRKLRRAAPISAGFISGGVCHGESETLKLKSRGAADTKLLDSLPGAGQSGPEHVNEKGWTQAEHRMHVACAGVGPQTFVPVEAEAARAAGPRPAPKLPDVSELLVWAVEDGLLGMSKIMDADLQDALVAYSRRILALASHG